MCCDKVVGQGGIESLEKACPVRGERTSRGLTTCLCREVLCASEAIGSVSELCLVVAMSANPRHGLRSNP